MRTDRRHDPGDCLVCGTAHCACGTPTEALTVVPGPARDGTGDRPTTLLLGTGADGLPFTTATYRGLKPRR